MKQFFALLAGLLFGIGLLISGMTDPAKVRAFLDLFGKWDPSLALVMMGGIVVHCGTMRLVLRRSAPVFASSFDLPKKQDITAPLLLGSATFGVGWGLAGVCPGPAIVCLGSFGVAPFAFVLSMILGMAITRAGWPRQTVLST
jgi:uncharacterized membrane protein YedE/YeeE